MQKETIKKLDIIFLTVSVGGLVITYLGSLLSGDKGKNELPFLGILYIVIGLTNTIAYILSWKEIFSKMNSEEKMMWLRRFWLGLLLIVFGMGFFGVFSN